MVTESKFKRVHDKVCPRCGGYVQRADDFIGCPRCGAMLTRKQLILPSRHKKDWGIFA